MITASRRSRFVAAVLVGLAYAVSLAGFQLLPGIFQIWNLRAVDQLYALRDHWSPHDSERQATVVHVDLTNSSAAALGSRYLNRAHFARVIENLRRMEVSAQLWDFILAQPRNSDQDRALIEATRRAGSVYFGAALRLTQESDTRPLQGQGWMLTVEGDAGKIMGGTDPLFTFDALEDAAKGVGSISIRFDRDGVLRRIPLLLRVGDRFFPSLPLLVACDRMQVSPGQVIVRPGDAVYLINARPPEGKRRTLRLPIDDRGNLLVNFVGGWERFDHYNLADIFFASEDRYELEMWAEELRGKVVVVSDVSTGAADIGPVPGDPAFPLSGVHTQVIDSILTGSFLEEISAPGAALVDLVLFSTVMALTLFAPSVAFTIGMASVACAYLAFAAGAFLHAGLILELVRPLLFVLLAAVSILVFRYVNEEREKLEGLRQRDLIRATFGRYLSNEVVEEILDKPEGLRRSGEFREVTILVSDLRGFTALSCALSPQTVIEILNRYLEVMVEIVSRFGGTVSELQGDGLLVYFGAPIARGRDPERAVACALTMQNALAEFNRVQVRRHLPQLGMGIGIETGEVVVGSIGSDMRAKYTAIGSPINAAFRIESITVGGQILIGENTYAKVADIVSVRRQRNAEFKGIEAPVRLYEVDGIGGAMAVKLAADEADLLHRLVEPVSVRVQMIESKQVSGAPMEAFILAVGRRQLEARLPERVRPHGSIRVRLGDSFREIPDAYAVIETVVPEEGDTNHFRALLRLTWLPEESRRHLESIGLGSKQADSG